MFYYCVRYWDEIDCIERKDSGLVVANDYNFATDKVVKYYGKENVFSVTVEQWEEILCEDEILEGFEKEEN